MINLRTLVLTSVSILSLSAPALAQEAPQEDDDSTSGEAVIIVEARRREENVQDVPQVVNAVTAQAIEKLNIRNATEITSVVPGLSLTPNANGIGSSSSMRGVNHDVNVSGENGTIQYYANDVPVGSNFVLQAMFDIAQITVERGPQGTLRGRATPSGAINVNWRKPSLDEVGASISGSAGSDHASNLQFGIGVPVIKDILGIRVAGLADRGRGNRIRSVNNSTLPTTRTEAIRATVQFEPTDFIKAGFVYEGMRYDARQYDQSQSMSDVVPGFTIPAVDQSITGSIVPFTAPALGTTFAGNYGTLSLSDRKSVAFTPRTVHTDFRFFSWNAEVDLAGQRLIYVGSDTRTNFHPVTNSDPGAIWPALTLQQNTTTASEGSTHEIRLQNGDRVAGMFDYVVGYFRSTGSSETILTSQTVLEIYAPTLAGQGNLQLQRVAGIVNTTPIYLAPGKGTEESFFGNVVVHIGDATEISGGLRHIKSINDAKGLFISCTPATYAAGSCTVSNGSNNSYNLKHTIYNVAIRHRFNDNLMAYVASGSSMRPPVRAIGDFSTSYSPLEAAHLTFGAETSKSYEVGFKSEWLDRKLKFNATYYHQDFKNYPFRAATGVYYININSSNQANRAQFNFISAVPVKVDGVEAELAYNPSRHFSFGTTLSWSKSSVDKNAKIACVDVNKDGVPDSAVPTLAQLQTAYGSEHIAECNASGSATFLPEWSGSAQAEYTATLTGDVDGYLRGLLSWKGSTQNDPQNPYDDVGAYGLINLYAGLRDSDGAWELGVYAKNVGNVTRLVSGEAAGNSNSTTILKAAGGAPSPVGSRSYPSYYRNVSVTNPREIGVSLRFALGAR